jgi:hypothetical protein
VDLSKLSILVYLISPWKRMGMDELGTWMAKTIRDESNPSMVHPKLIKYAVYEQTEEDMNLNILTAEYLTDIYRIIAGDTGITTVIFTDAKYRHGFYASSLQNFLSTKAGCHIVIIQFVDLMRLEGGVRERVRKWPVDWIYTVTTSSVSTDGEYADMVMEIRGFVDMMMDCDRQHHLDLIIYAMDEMMEECYEYIKAYLHNIGCRNMVPHIRSDKELDLVLYCMLLEPTAAWKNADTILHEIGRLQTTNLHDRLNELKNRLT